MKHKVSELEGGLLAHAAALACGYRVEREDPTLEIWVVWFPADERGTLGPVSSFGPFGWRPDMKWVHGGPIIDREHIDIDHMVGRVERFRWRALCGSQRAIAFGPTALIAAMRAFVASKFGDEVDLP